MRKQTKIAAVVSAAALLALGASITSFAGAKGTWMLVDGEWYCYDKNGDVYENTFCNSNGKEYYVGEDGMLVRSDWVEYDGDYYFVNSSGAKVTNDWRLTTPYEDEDGEEEWYYFQSTGKRADNKKIVYKGQTFFFDAEGKMLTGWVTASGTDVANEENEVSTSSDRTTYFCDETGARVQGAWIYTTEPTAEDDEADAEEHYYWLKSSGKVQTGKASNIKGQTYFFNNEGQMLTGWVALEASGSNGYAEIDGENSGAVLSAEDYEAVYYCGGEDDGHAKKNKWIKTWRPADTYEEDEDADKFWYWIEKDGKVFIPEAVDATGTKYDLADADMDNKGTYNITKKKVNSKDYFFNQNGEMFSNFLEVEEIISSDSNVGLYKGMYYFGGGDDGSMKTGAQTLKDDNGDSYKFYFGTKTTANEKKGVGVTGNKNNKLYYKGLLMQAVDYKYQVATLPMDDGTVQSFIVNQNGSVQHSNIKYTEDGDTLIDATEKVGDDYVVTFNKATDAGVAKYAVLGLTVEDSLKVNINNIMP